MSCLRPADVPSAGPSWLFQAGFDSSFCQCTPKETGERNLVLPLCQAVPHIWGAHICSSHQPCGGQRGPEPFLSAVAYSFNWHLLRLAASPALCWALGGEQACPLELPLQVGDCVAYGPRGTRWCGPSSQSRGPSESLILRQEKTSRKPPPREKLRVLGDQGCGTFKSGGPKSSLRK